MKIAFSFIIISIINISFAKEFNLQERIKSDQYYRSLHSLIHKNNSYSNIKDFKEIVLSLSETKRLEVSHLVNELTQTIPSPFLRPLIYWKVISPNKIKLRNVLTYIMIYKLNTLRDFYQSPLLTNKEKDNSRQLISSIYHRNNFNESNLLPSLLEDFTQKSQIISDFTDITDFITAVEETSSLSFNLLDHRNITPYTLSFSGLIPGNEIKIFNNNPIDSERIEFYSQKGESDLSLFDKGEHTIFKTEPIFIQLKEIIKNANQSIIISMDEINGSIGLSVLKYLTDTAKEKSKENPLFKILVMTQNNNSITQLIRDRIINDPVLKDIIHIVDTQVGLKKNNSKVIVVDANSKTPIAIVSSKSWSDSKGGYFFGNDILVKGPAAALIQNSLYHDLKYLDFDKNILNHFKISREIYPYVGDQVARLSESSIDNKINNTRDTIIDMIKRAKSHIYMEQLYLYDTYIINALVKRKLEIPKIDIRILADHNESVGLNGLPNTIYLRELKLYNIHVKARKNSSFTQRDKTYHRENHRNIISIDGKVLHTGSASISPEALQGDTREIGIQIYDTSAIRRFERNFLISWNDRNRVMDLDIQNFRASTNGERISKEISSLINAIASSLLAVKDEIIEKF